ncbi:M20 peptidase aminoacylase family protein [Phocicoccus pinnipedialis]|uniref:Putative hydrolase YxeP n=1 Tax=Phocicoccus pinnipedialis TaxID=110845 RepID=A0A6V7R420_9BACL|nr:M20 peptidase aminoacylase family protein [Jeotgalicoccus pinnipedialis]MBP1939976.1 amidohydrolase [Jeotgalicoccus pinnipedialis]CAD2072076.1 putative hydrolase YxeP [Jeotgalicoccus pinnipedialis]
MSNAEIYEVFEHVHQNPEISLEEYETTEYIFNFLKERGFNPIKFKNVTGLYCDVGDFSADSLKIGVRADIDALWQEVNGIEQANHSCGHDSHIAMVIGAMLKVKDEVLVNKGVRFVFQPAEELGLGAKKVIEEGVIDVLDYMFGIHLRPIEEAKDGYASPSIEHGASGSVTFKIVGHDAHGARPHLNHNVIEIGSDLLNMLSSIHVNPMVPSSIKMTKFHAGGKSLNIIPGSAEFGIDVRAQTNEVMTEIQERIKEILESISELYDVRIENLDMHAMVASQSDNDAIDILRSAIIDTIGPDKLLDPIVTSGGDDFHFYTVENPKLKGAMIGLGCDLTPGLHHPYMKFNHDSMPVGSAIIYQAIMNAE